MDIVRNSPKLSSKLTGRHALYRYYAGFSGQFVEEVLRKLPINEQEFVFDPWNGSGTTTLSASSLGIKSIGMDINPVMIIVSKSKQVTADFWSSVSGLAAELISIAQHYRLETDRDDGLYQWVDPNTSFAIRTLDQAIQRLLYPKEWSHRDDNQRWNDISSVAAFFMVALFRTLRTAVGRLSSNPTWDKKPVHPLIVNQNIYELFKSVTDAMSKELREDQNYRPKASATILYGDSREIPLADECIGTVISSPPYCTRIDYAAATRLELTIINPFIESSFRRLREKMIGSPIVVNGARNADIASIGETAYYLLKRIEEHPSKASATYYYKTYRRYFSELIASLVEVERVLKPNGKGVLVVQSSYYKDVEVDLPQIVLEMASNLGLKSSVMFSEAVTQTMEKINTVSRRYNRKRRYFEKVIYFGKNMI